MKTKTLAIIVGTLFVVNLLHAVFSDEPESVVSPAVKEKVKRWKRSGSKVPVQPISHTKDGKMIIGTANAEGTR